MFTLPETLAAWNTPEFKDTLKQELERLGPAGLPLQQALSYSSHALDEPIRVIALGAEEGAATIDTKVGVFFSGLTPGCGCADDPTPIEPQNEYCELIVAIDKATAEARVTIIED